MNSLEVIDTWIEPTPLWGVLMCAFATSSWSPGSLSRFFASLLSPLWQRDFQHELLVPILGKPLISARRPIRLDLSLSSSYSRSCTKNRGKPLTKLSPYNKNETEFHRRSWKHPFTEKAMQKLSCSGKAMMISAAIRLLSRLLLLA